MCRAPVRKQSAARGAPVDASTGLGTRSLPAQSGDAAEAGSSHGDRQGSHLHGSKSADAQSSPGGSGGGDKPDACSDQAQAETSNGLHENAEPGAGPQEAPQWQLYKKPKGVHSLDLNAICMPASLAMRIA